MPQNEAQLEQLVAFFQALADLNRLKIVGMLAQHPASVEELVDALQVQQSTVSHHLAKLKALGLVNMRKEGQTHRYYLDEEILRTMAKQILSPENLAEAAPPFARLSFEEKTLRSFFGTDGRLKVIPAQRKKRDVILQQLVQQFETGQRYPEPHVNEILLRFHEDVFTLRRELIMAGLLERENGVYWRP
ncbi:MAG TPA: metalloregulator ArsR/SmtB family transcription factor [Symbiobacteriaceae bacterium]|nr:metalloregulator ArsR/SmtB family transcription factor [Symbiobacteriaceae bacterium]